MEDMFLPEVLETSRNQKLLSRSWEYLQMVWRQSWQKYTKASVAISTTLYVFETVSLLVYLWYQQIVTYLLTLELEYWNALIASLWFPLNDQKGGSYWLSM